MTRAHPHPRNQGSRDPPRLAWIVACGAVIGLLTVLFSADGYRREIAIALHEFVTWIDPGKRAIRIKVGRARSLLPDWPC